MIRRFIALFLLLAFAAQLSGRTLVMMDYYVNRAAYQKSCINKSRPMLHCQGKCQMMKKIREQEKKEAQNNERKTTGKNEPPPLPHILPV
jgi:hypothetical protein